ncbi:MAG: hypothetical protein M0P71_16540 [Melioribacteraceae bacterium]|nr:hypothetical protein [Melioribacteraceae bacterium]
MTLIYIIIFIAIFILVCLILSKNQAKKMTPIEKHNLYVSRRKIEKGFEHWQHENFVKIYRLYSQTPKEITFSEFAKGVYEGKIILEDERRIKRSR